MVTYSSKIQKPISFGWLDVGNQFEYENRPYIKIEYKSHDSYKSSYNSYAFSYTSGKIVRFSPIQQVYKTNFNIKIK